MPGFTRTSKHMIEDLGDTPFDISDRTWTGSYVSLDGCMAGPITLEDVESVIHHYEDGDRWDGKELVVLKLKDGRYVGYETWYGPTGSGFFRDAYGGDVDVCFANDYHVLMIMGMGDEARERFEYTPEILVNVELLSRMDIIFDE